MLVVLFQILALALLSIRTWSGSIVLASPAVLSAAASTRRAGAKATKLCVLFGWPSGAGEELQLLGEDVVSLSLSSAAEMYQVSGFDVAVGYVKASDALLDSTETKLFQGLVALLEGCAGASPTATSTATFRKQQIAPFAGKTFMFYLDGISQGSTRDQALYAKVCKKIGEIVQEAVELVFPNSASNRVDIRFESSFDSVISIVNGVAATRTGEQIATGIDAGREKSYSSFATFSGYATSIEANAAAALLGLTDEFVRDIRTSVSSLGSTATVEGVASAVKDTVEIFNHNHEKVINAYTGTEALRAADYYARSQLTRSLEPVYKQLLDSIVAEGLASFESLARKVPPDSRLESALHLGAKSVVENVQKSCKKLQHDFTSIVSKLNEGLFRDKRVATKFIRSNSFAFTSVQLESDLKERIADRVRMLFLQGAFNPYVRDLPWAPTHININYLVDPRAFALGLEYNKLYDEHVEGPVNRAEPLWIRGVTKVAFDPNDHPVSLEKNSWWTTLRDFYSSD